MEPIALALGGGGIKGIAHIGVLRRLEREGFSVGAIAGTSAGGVVGAMYAAGYTPTQIEEILLKLDQSRLFARQARDERPSLLGLDGLTHALAETLGERTFDDLKIPFACTAVDIISSQEIILTRGRLVDAVLATVAVPGVFPPREIDSSFLLVDGGILDPVPVALARWLAPTMPIMAVCLSPELDDWAELPAMQVPESSPIPYPILEYFARMRIGKAIQIFVTSMDVSARMLAELRMQVDRPDVIIRPDVKNFGILDRVNPNELIALGENAIDEAMPAIQEALSIPRFISRKFRREPIPPGKIIETDQDDFSVPAPG